MNNNIKEKSAIAKHLTLTLALIFLIGPHTTTAHAGLFENLKGLAGGLEQLNKQNESETPPGQKIVKKNTTSYTSSSSDDNRPLKTKEEIAGLQDCLNKIGLDAGSPDGIVGDKTRHALSTFEAYLQAQDPNRKVETSVDLATMRNCVVVTMVGTINGKVIDANIAKKEEAAKPTRLTGTIDAYYEGSPRTITWTAEISAAPIYRTNISFSFSTTLFTDRLGYVFYTGFVTDGYKKIRRGKANKDSRKREYNEIAYCTHENLTKYEKNLDEICFQHGWSLDGCNAKEQNAKVDISCYGESVSKAGLGMDYGSGTVKRKMDFGFSEIAFHCGNDVILKNPPGTFKVIQRAKDQLSAKDYLAGRFDEETFSFSFGDICPMGRKLTTVSAE